MSELLQVLIIRFYQCCFLAVIEYRTQENGQAIKRSKCFSQRFMHV